MDVTGINDALNFVGGLMGRQQRKLLLQLLQINVFNAYMLACI